MTVQQSDLPDVLALVGASARRSDQVARRGYRIASPPGSAVMLCTRSSDPRVAAQTTGARTTALVGLTTAGDGGALLASAGGDLVERLVTDPLGVVGHFAGLVVDADRLSIVTDHVGSVPVYEASLPDDPDAIVTGTDLGDVAMLAARTAIDPVSALEFVQSGVITHPYTIFDGVRRVEPGTVTVAQAGSVRYWTPSGDLGDADVAAVAAEMSDVMDDNLRRLLDRHRTVVLLMSGGEDSRVLAHRCRRLRSDADDLRAVIFVDAANREWRLASAAARSIGVPLEARRRSPDHYTASIGETVGLVGGGIDLTHAHSTGLVDGSEADLFLDGWSADSYCKAHTVTTTRRHVRGVALGLEHPDLESMTVGPEHWTAAPTGRHALDRRERKLARLRELRPDDAIAWMSLWPVSDHPEFGLFRSNWRARPSASPYMFANLVALAAAVPIEEKVDRRLFHRAFSSSLGAAGWIPRTAGQIPRLAGYPNLLAANVVKAVFRTTAFVQRRRGVTVAQGPWQSFATRRAAVQAAMEAAPPELLARADVLGRGDGEAPYTGRWSTDQSHRVLQLAALLGQQEGPDA